MSYAACHSIKLFKKSNCDELLIIQSHNTLPNLFRNNLLNTLALVRKMQPHLTLYNNNNNNNNNNNLIYKMLRDFSGAGTLRLENRREFQGT